MNKLKVFLSITLIASLICCRNINNESSSDKQSKATKSKKEEILQTMSGIWSNKYNSYLELDLLQEKPILKNKDGIVSNLEIESYDTENLIIIAKLILENGNKEGITLRLVKLQDDTYALSWKYDRGQIMMFSFVRNLDRYMEK